MDWRGIFFVLAGAGLALFFVAVFLVRETLPAAGRHSGELSTSMLQFVELAREKAFGWLVLASGVAGAAFFTYLAMCSFVFQNEYEVSAEHFSWIFAGNAVSMLIGAQVGAAFVRRIGPRRMYLIGITAETAAVMGMANFVIGPVVAPLASLGGASGLTMATTMLIATGIAVAIAWCAVRPLTVRMPGVGAVTPRLPASDAG